MPTSDTATKRMTRSDFRLFLARLEQLIAEEFDDTEFRLATKAELDPSLVKRIRSGDRAPTPLFVGKIGKAVDRKTAHEVIAAYLKDVERQVLRMRPSRRG